MATPREPSPVAVPLRREALARLTAPLHRHRGRRSARGIDSQSRMLGHRTVNQNKGHWVTLLLAQRSPLPGNSYFWRTASIRGLTLADFLFQVFHTHHRNPGFACGSNGGLINCTGGPAGS